MSFKDRFIDAIAQPANQEGITYSLALNTLLAGGIALGALKEGNVSEGLQAATLAVTLGAMTVNFANGAEAGYAAQGEMMPVPVASTQATAHGPQ